MHSHFTNKFATPITDAIKKAIEVMEAWQRYSDEHPEDSPRYQSSRLDPLPEAPRGRYSRSGSYSFVRPAHFTRLSDRRVRPSPVGVRDYVVGARRRVRRPYGLLAIDPVS